MQAVILAGGLGIRLRPLTERVPKVMIPIKGKPFFLYLLELLKSQEIRHVVLCIGYLGGHVRDFLGNGKSFGLSIKYSEEKERLLGTGGALKQARSLLDDHFFVINGDTYLPIEYIEVEKTFLRLDKKALMVVYDNHEDTGVENNVELNNDLMVTNYEKENPSPSLKYVEAGVLALRREALDLIKEGGPISLEKGLYPVLIQQKELTAYITRQRFYDIGTPELKVVFEQYLKSGAK